MNSVVGMALNWSVTRPATFCKPGRAARRCKAADKSAKVSNVGTEMSGGSTPPPGTTEEGNRWGLLTTGGQEVAKWHCVAIAYGRVLAKGGWVRPWSDGVASKQAAGWQRQAARTKGFNAAISLWCDDIAPNGTDEGHKP